MTGSTSSRLVIAKSVRVITAVGSVAELFPGTGSVSLPVTVAVFDKFVVVEEFTRTTTVTVSVALFARLPTAPVRTPFATLTVPCVVVAETNVVPGGSGSLARTPVASDGPLFVRVNVYVSSWPAVTGSTSSRLVIAKSARVITAVGSVAELLAGTVSGSLPVTVAVFVSEPVAFGETRTRTVIVAELPFAMLPRFPVTVPFAKLTDPCVVVAESKMTFANSGSLTLTPVAFEGP